MLGIVVMLLRHWAQSSLPSNRVLSDWFVLHTLFGKLEIRIMCGQNLFILSCELWKKKFYQYDLEFPNTTFYLNLNFMFHIQLAFYEREKMKCSVCFRKKLWISSSTVHFTNNKTYDWTFYKFSCTVQLKVNFFAHIHMWQNYVLDQKIRSSGK